MTEPTVERKPWTLAFVKRAVPVLVSALILYHYFHDQDWEAILLACSRANLLLAVLAVFIPQVVFWLFEALIYERHIRWFHAPFPIREFFWVRGAIYILQFVNTALGGGGLLLYLQRKARISWRKLLGILLFRTGITLWGVGFVMVPATLAMHYYGLDDKVRINMYAWWFVLLVPGVLWFIANWLFWFHGIDIGGLGRLIVRDRGSEFWTAFAASSPRQWVYTFGMTLPPFILTIVGFYFLNLAFDIRVPFWEFMVAGPLALLIMDLPIAFAGFGTATVAWMTFFGDYGSEQDMAALTLFLPFGRAAARSIIGLVSLRPALKDVGSLFQHGDKDVERASPVPTKERP